MASSIKFYTIRNMDKAVCDSAASQATGHPKENLYDNNLDTYWKPTTTSDQTIDFDLQELRWVSHVIVFVKNYKSIAAGDYDVYYSDNGSDWYMSAINHTLIDTATPLRISTDFYSKHRYWRIIFDNMSQIIEVAGVWWGRLYTFSQGNVIPQEDDDQYHNRISRLPGGRLAVAGINRNRTENMGRRYLVETSGSWATLRTVYDDSRGCRHPLFVNEGAAQSDARVVRFAADTFERPITALGLYDLQVRMEGVPYIDDGDSY